MQGFPKCCNFLSKYNSSRTIWVLPNKKIGWLILKPLVRPWCACLNRLYTLYNYYYPQKCSLRDKTISYIIDNVVLSQIFIFDGDSYIDRQNKK